MGTLREDYERYRKLVRDRVEATMERIPLRSANRYYADVRLYNSFLYFAWKYHNPTERKQLLADVEQFNFRLAVAERKSIEGFMNEVGDLRTVVPSNCREAPPLGLD